jgi:hypothetical protein
MPIEELRLQNDRRLAMAMLALFLIPTVWYLQTDFTVFAGDWSRLTLRLFVRGTMVAVAFAAVIALASVRSRAAYSRVVFATGLALAAALVAINALRPEYSDLPLRSPLFTIAVMYGLMPNSTIRQILPPLLLSVALIILRFAWLSSAANADVAGDVLILIVLNTAGILMVLRRRALERALDRAWQGELDARLANDRALAELRSLHGIIPICSFCKKVRTEVGSWQQIERYVQQHSQAEFSHGVCPDCRDTHYAEFSPDRAS